MNEEINKETPAEENPGQDPNQPSGENPEAPKEDPKETPDETPEGDGGSEGSPKEEDIDYDKKLSDLDKTIPPKRSEVEKAEHTIKSIFSRHPNLAEKYSKGDDSNGDSEESVASRMQSRQDRIAVEGIIRGNSKSSSEIKYKMAVYDRLIVKTGDPYEDADNAEWLANKNRTKNAINEMKRKPPSPGSTASPGSKEASPDITPLPEAEIKAMKKLGMKQVAPDRWEGKKVGLKFNKGTKAWEQFMVQAKK